MGKSLPWSGRHKGELNPLEVAAWVKAQLRRQQLAGQPNQEETRIHDWGRFRVDEGAGQLTVEGTVIPCPARELQLLSFLCRHPNRIFSKAQLYEQVWGEESLGEDNTVMVHVRRLREKIELLGYGERLGVQTAPDGQGASS